MCSYIAYSNRQTHSDVSRDSLEVAGNDILMEKGIGPQSEPCGTSYWIGSGDDISCCTTNFELN